jgi:GNAT superfamily N-acetyltransferase
MGCGAKIRQATEGDIESITELWQQLVDYHAQLGPNWAPAPDRAEHFVRFLADQLAKEEVLILIAEVGGQPVGYCHAAIGSRPPIFEQTEHCLVLDLVVAESDRKRGTGGRLLAAIEDWARDRGVRRIEVGVACSNSAAVSFYSNRGFVAFSQRMGKDIPPE